jgi:adenylyltransferase/sulfurtransferase
VLPGIVGTIQAAEAIKLILGAGDTLAGRLLLFDVLAMNVRTLQLRRDPECPISGDRPTITSLIDYEQFCGVAPQAQAASPPALPPEFETTVHELKADVDAGRPVWILDVREPREYEICRIAGSTLVPLGDLVKRVRELPDPSSGPDIVVHCKSGVRSAKAVNQLRELGYTRIRNLKGGILEWIRQVDPTQSAY